MSLVADLGIGLRATRRARAERRSRAVSVPVRAYLARVAGASLSLAGLGLVDAAAFDVGRPLGFLVTGLSLFVAEWRVNE
jgi:hypothetical protein